jgi:hypothetical protein
MFAENKFGSKKTENVYDKEFIHKQNTDFYLSMDMIKIARGRKHHFKIAEFKKLFELRPE